MALRVELKNWFYGFEAPERGEIVLGHRRVYIVPSRLGLFFAGALGILLVGSINYALSLGFALTFLLAGMGIAAMVQTTRNLARLSVRPGRSEAEHQLRRVEEHGRTRRLVGHVPTRWLHQLEHSAHS